MKQAEIKIGAVYLTKIGRLLQRVIVPDSVNDTTGRVRFRVRPDRPGSAVLPKSRAASALHPAKHADDTVTDAVLSARDAERTEPTCDTHRENEERYE